MSSELTYFMGMEKDAFGFSVQQKQMQISQQNTAMGIIANAGITMSQQENQRYLALLQQSFPNYEVNNVTGGTYNTKN